MPVIEFALKSPSDRNLTVLQQKFGSNTIDSTTLPDTLRIVPPPELAWAHQRQETGRAALAFNVFPDELSAALRSHTIEQIMVWGVRHNDYAGADFQQPHWQQPQCFEVLPLTVDPDHPPYHALNMKMLRIVSIILWELRCQDWVTMVHLLLTEMLEVKG